VRAERACFLYLKPYPRSPLVQYGRAKAEGLETAPNSNCRVFPAHRTRRRHILPVETPLCLAVCPYLDLPLVWVSLRRSLALYRTAAKENQQTCCHHGQLQYQPPRPPASTHLPRHVFVGRAECRVKVSKQGGSSCFPPPHNAQRTPPRSRAARPNRHFSHRIRDASASCAGARAMVKLLRARRPTSLDTLLDREPCCA